ncbi:hypothetical protein A2U01_0089636, partial [Trifolium medium]|nr:hypothetical protein [Trifolium medium]
NSRSPQRRHHRSATPPPRRDNNHQKRPALERPQQPSKKRDRTPPREDRVSPTAKKGNQTERPEQWRRSPQGLKLMERHVTSS